MTQQTATAQIIDMPSAEVHQIQSMQATEVMMNDASMNRLMKMAEVMATSKVTVPKHLQGSAGDCFAVVMQAAQWGMNPFSVAQKTHLVNGVLGYEAQLVNAVITQRAPITGRLQFEFYGDWTKVDGKLCKSAEVGVKVWATFKGEEEPRLLDIGMHQVGNVRNSPMWQADPRQQLAYLAVKRWSRLYCPDVILGVYTPDELDSEPERDVSPHAEPKKHSGSANLKTRLSQGRDKPVIDGEAKAFDIKAYIAEVNAAQTVDELKAVAKKAPVDIGEPEKTQIKDACQARLDAIKAAPKQYMPKESINAIKTEFTKCGDNESLQSVWDSRVMSHRAAISADDYAELEMAYTAQLDAINA